ncbi:MAG: hypothetical protein ACO3DH_09140 [Candidatus Kapaibacteriota bacterium]
MRFLTLLCCIFTIGILTSCKSLDDVSELEKKMSIYEDAVRIKPELTEKYFQKSSGDANRDGRTLRGYVEYVQIKRDSANKPIDTVFAFREKINNKPSAKGLLIPIKDIETIPTLFPGIQTDSLGGFNLVESFHVTKNIPEIRSIPVQDVLNKNCDCQPFSLNMGLDLSLRLALGLDAGIGLSCFDRDYSEFWAASHLRTSSYNDGIVNDALYGTSEFGRLQLGGDFTAGIRVGEDYRWAFGLTFVQGMQTVNAGAFDPKILIADMPLVNRPIGLFTTRHYLVPVKNSQKGKKSESFFYVDVYGDEADKPVREEKEGDGILKALFGCMKPYVYNEFGFAFDAASLAALSMSLGLECDDCTVRIKDAQANGDINMNWSFPLTYGFGVGVDIPIMSDLDLEIDVGYRDVAVGDSYSLLGFSNVPGTRRLGTFQLRLGVMY